MARQLRIVGVQLKVDVVVDDGEDLEPVQVDPLYVTGKQWDSFDLNASLAGLREQLAKADAVPASEEATS